MGTKRGVTLWLTLALAWGAGSNADVALAGEPTARAMTDSADVVAVADRFHAALAAGDSATALALLADDAVILESGARQTKQEYREHHLPADISFARAMRSQRAPLAVTVKGDVAWTSGTSTTTGDYGGRAVNSSGVESMVLVRTGQGWRIAAIHWSSRQRRAG
jgi:ketosteroid isomerase-like protein